MRRAAYAAIAVVASSALSPTGLARGLEDYVVARGTYRGKPIVCVVVPPSPPPGFHMPAVHIAAVMRKQGAKALSDVPALDWCYGCSPTSAAMMFGYYDRTGYPHMYVGPTNGGVFPLDNSPWGTGECPLSASHKGYDNRTTRGHVDDYWISTGNSDPDPYVTGGWTPHRDDCVADFMGTSQSAFGNSDGSTTFYFYVDGSPLIDYTGCEPSHRDGCHGLRLFVESRAYEALTNFNQYIFGYKGNARGFTFSDFQAEIDAGRPVLIQLAGHTVLGFGYDASTQTVYIHDTWDHEDHQMTWGGSYADMQHYGVTVLHLAAAEHIVTITAGPSGDPNPVASGATVQCSVTAEDSRNHALAYQWTAVDAEGNPAGSFDDATKQNPVWTAPENRTDDPVDYTITVTVTCEKGKTATGSFVETVNPVEDTVTITAMEIAGTGEHIVRVRSEERVQCSVTAEDSRNHELAYRWTAEDEDGEAIGEFDDPTKENPVWAAPDTLEETRVTITVECICTGGASARESRTVMVVPWPLGDIDRDDAVTLADLAEFLLAWRAFQRGNADWNRRADLDRNGRIDTGDAETLLDCLLRWQARPAGAEKPGRHAPTPPTPATAADLRRADGPPESSHPTGH